MVIDEIEDTLFNSGRQDKCFILNIVKYTLLNLYRHLI